MTNVSGRRAWTIVGLLSVAGFINYLDRAVLSVALPVVSRELGLDPTAKGVLLSSFFWSYAIMQLPAGWASDRWNMRWFYAGMFALWSVACGLTGFAGTLAVLLALRVLLGIGESVYLPGGVKVVNMLIPPDRHGLASGLVNCGTRFGLALGAPLTAWLVTTRGWRDSFFIVGFSSLIWLLPWLLACPSAPSRPAAAARTGRPAWLDRNLAGICLAHVGFSYYWYLFVTWLPDYLVESRHMSLERAGAFAFIPYLVFSVCEPLGGWLADLLIRAGWPESRARKSVITLAFCTSLALLPGVRLQDDVAAICLIGAAAMVGLATGNILALLQRFAPAHEVGLWTGILNFAGNLSGIVAPLVTGILISRTSSYAPGFSLAVFVLLAGLPAYWFMVDDVPAAERTTHA
jgi:MFS family permease